MRGARRITVLFCLWLILFAAACLNFAFAAQPVGKPAPTAAATDGKKTAGQQTGKILEVLHAGSYDYLRVDTGKETIWLGVPATDLKPGQKVVFRPGTPMTNFESKSLGRKFEMVYLVDQISGEGVKPRAQTLPEGHPSIDGSAGKSAGAPKLDFSRITKPAGGKNVAEIYKEKPQLLGKKVAVRGKVVKFNSGIMGKNWIHLRDGTGTEGANDLTVTTEDTAKIGDTVLVRGAVVADKDFGHGYKYPLIIEDAKITVE
jgi:hypothetical protein